MITVVKADCGTDRGGRLNRVLDRALEGVSFEEVDAADFCGARNGRVLFCAALSAGGPGAGYRRILEQLVLHPDCLEGSCGGILVDGPGELFTKQVGRELAFFACQAGMDLPGKPMVEATGSLYNFRTQARLQNVDVEEAYCRSAARLIRTVEKFRLPGPAEGEKPRILAIHASSRKTSNTLLLWQMIRERIGDRGELEEISLRNGTVVDCRGCSFQACLHFGEQADCFYGGVMVEKVYPAILRADEIMLICPNYNDAVSANINAFFNRLTALFRKNFEDFSRKRVYGLVVSGYSGGDIVAEQILDAMCLNKNFSVQGHGILTETANDPRSILKCPGIDSRADEMAERMLK